MLAGQADGWDCQFHGKEDPSNPDPRFRKLPKVLAENFGCRSADVTPDVALAKTRLEEGFAFVGLFEEFELSICLFHTIFGHRIRAVELNKLRESAGGLITPPSNRSAWRAARPTTPAKVLL